MRLHSSPVSRYVVKVVWVAIAYWGSGWLLLSGLGLSTQVSPLWFPAGIALAILLVGGQKLWPGILVGDFLLMLLRGASWELAISSAIGSTLSASIGVKLLHYSKFSPKLTRIRDVTALIVLAATLAPMLNASLDTAAYWIAGSPDRQGVGQHWSLLWLGDCSGILAIAPGIICPQPNCRGLLRQKLIKHWLETAVGLAILVVLSWLVFAYPSASVGGWTGTQSLEYLPFPGVVWAAIRFQTWGAILASSIVSVIALIGTLQGRGPFVLQTANVLQATLLLQTFTIIITATALLLSAAVAERTRAERQLRETLLRDRLLAEVALNIRQSLDLGVIFQTAVNEIRSLIHADRVLISLFQDQGQLEAVAESLKKGYPTLLEANIDSDLINEIQFILTKPQTFISDNISQFPLSSAVRDHVRRYQIKACAIVPLHLNAQPLGLLVAHQCSGPRCWQPQEIQLLEQLATQVTIAIHQAQLYQQVQQLNCNLERQVSERTRQLQDSMRELHSLHKMKAVFWQAVSHDLRTSIMGLLMLLKNLQHCNGENLLLSGPMLQRMIESSDRQLTLINALSEDHFAEPRQAVVNCQPLDLSDFLRVLMHDWQPVLAQNGATLTYSIPKTLPCLQADPQQLRQVCDRLLDNALKHNPPGIELTFEALIDRGMVRCSLQDNGVGMEPQQCERLFKLYVRSLHNQRLTGIGLGSYECRQIIEAHGGQIGVDSQPGRGSQFWFTLPVASPQPTAVSQ